MPTVHQTEELQPGAKAIPDRRGLIWDVHDLLTGARAEPAIYDAGCAEEAKAAYQALPTRGGLVALVNDSREGRMILYTARAGVWPEGQTVALLHPGSLFVFDPNYHEVSDLSDIGLTA